MNSISGQATNCAAMVSSESRTGRWTNEELLYVNLLIHTFDSGQLLLPSGTKLLDFLSAMLKCKPSRLTKKFKHGGLTRGYKISVSPISDDARNSHWDLSNSYLTFLRSLGSEGVQAEMKLHTTSQWRHHFCQYSLKSFHKIELEGAEEYLKSVEELERRVDAHTKWERSGRLNNCTSASRTFCQPQGLARISPEIVTSNASRKATTVMHDYTPKRVCRAKDFQLDMEPVRVTQTTTTPTSSIHMLGLTDNSAPCAKISNISLDTEEEKITTSSSHIIAQVEDEHEEEFLNLWGFHSSDVGIVGSDPNTKIKKDANATSNIPTSLVDTTVSSTRQIKSNVCKGTVCKVAPDITSDVKSSVKSQRGATSNTLNSSNVFATASRKIIDGVTSSKSICNTNWKSDVASSGATSMRMIENVDPCATHPFLAELFKYAQTLRLPFEYYDLWVPSYVGDDTHNDSKTTGGGLINSLSEESHGGTTENNMRLIFAGHITVEHNLSLVPKDTPGFTELKTFGEYSSHFQFRPNHGLPGRVHANFAPCWEQSVQFAPSSHFERVEGAALTGIKTAVGIPVLSKSVGHIVVGCYSCIDMGRNDGLVGKLLKDFAGWNPVPRWTLVIEEGTHAMTMEGEQKARESAPNELSDIREIERDILNLLAEQIPLPVSSTSSSENELLHGYMMLRMLLLRPPASRTEEDHVALDIVCRSFINYTKSRNHDNKNSWSRREMGQVLVREFSFLRIRHTSSVPGSSGVSVPEIPTVEEKKCVTTCPLPSTATG
eukprot:CAMPEP_0195508140 /NCGR_PEP_ID=MMETSP0794_2-20130614/1432_1 /TAXON_ID=515487 /ORGANISM="Stephanopyxis turris, Strain CCMP 815" /LENGTH=773 /DNA_ID=CAMNT_0040635027 /DNA_START=286 /DNA_END=2607 /DNA_ORIENTATION=+